MFTALSEKIYVKPQSNPHSSIFLSSNTCYSYLNHVPHSTMTDVAKAIQDLCDQFKSHREDVDKLKKRKSKKSKKRKSRKSYSRSLTVTGDTTLGVELHLIALVVGRDRVTLGVGQEFQTIEASRLLGVGQASHDLGPDCALGVEQ